MSLSCRGASYTFIAVLTAAMVTCVSVAFALFSHSVTGGPFGVATSTLAPPTLVTAYQPSCHGSRPIEIALSWTATSSTYASSYTVERATAGNGSYVTIASVTASSTSYTDSEALAPYTTYYYRVSAVYRAWSATSSAVSVKTSSKTCG